MNTGDDLRAITLWCRSVDTESGTIRILRRVLRNCSWRERSIHTVMTTGQILSEPTLIRIFDDAGGLTYIPPHIWNALPHIGLGGYWTCDLSSPMSGVPTMLAPFESNEDIGSFTSAGQALDAEDAFMRRPENAGVVRAKEVNDNSGKQFSIGGNGKVVIAGSGRLGGHIRIRAGGGT